jgi:hypothetical protein
LAEDPEHARHQTYDHPGPREDIPLVTFGSYRSSDRDQGCQQEQDPHNQSEVQRQPRREIENRLQDALGVFGWQVRVQREERRKDHRRDQPDDRREPVEPAFHLAQIRTVVPF